MEQYLKCNCSWLNNPSIEEKRIVEMNLKNAYFIFWSLQCGDRDCDDSYSWFWDCISIRNYSPASRDKYITKQRFLLALSSLLCNMNNSCGKRLWNHIFRLKSFLIISVFFQYQSPQTYSSYDPYDPFDNHGRLSTGWTI